MEIKVIVLLVIVFCSAKTVLTQIKLNNLNLTKMSELIDKAMLIAKQQNGKSRSITAKDSKRVVRRIDGSTFLEGDVITIDKDAPGLLTKLGNFEVESYFLEADRDGEKVAIQFYPSCLSKNVRTYTKDEESGEYLPNGNVKAQGQPVTDMQNAASIGDFFTKFDGKKLKVKELNTVTRSVRNNGVIEYQDTNVGTFEWA